MKYIEVEHWFQLSIFFFQDSCLCCIQ